MSTEIILSESAYTIEQVVKQRELIKSAMKSAMEEGVHYGKIPGCGEKPSLMQSGAQLLCFLFKVRPEYDVTEVDFDAEHREYRILCKLIHTASGMEVGQGVGICSTRETKYRFRNEAKEVTWLDEPVPSVYWNLRKKPDDLKRWMETVFQGKDVSIIGTKKNDAGQWYFVEFHGGEGKVENPNIADVFNTVLKIAKKRAFVDATITVTASNDLFTQDLEDIAANLESAEAVTKESIAAKEKEQAAKSEPVPGAVKKEEKVTESATKPAAKASSATTPEDGETVNWRNVKCHIGTPGGKVHGREIGDMAKSTIDWLRAQMQKKDKPSKQDSILIAALAMEEAERTTKEASGKATPSLDLLRAKCEALKIPLAVVVTLDNKNGGTAENFMKITEDQAKYFLDNWEETYKIIKLEMDNLP